MVRVYQVDHGQGVSGVGHVEGSSSGIDDGVYIDVSDRVVPEDHSRDG
jgi:hypothetical protein